MRAALTAGGERQAQLSHAAAALFCNPLRLHDLGWSRSRDRCVAH
jgi:hypothetical protein